MRKRLEGSMSEPDFAAEWRKDRNVADDWSQETVVAYGKRMFDVGQDHRHDPATCSDCAKLAAQGAGENAAPEGAPPLYVHSEMEAQEKLERDAEQGRARKKYRYSFYLWLDRPAVTPLSLELTEVLRMGLRGRLEWDWTPLEFVKIRHSLQQQGLEMHEISRYSFGEAETVL